VIAGAAKPPTAASATADAERLPYVDEHAVILAAGIEDAWAALVGVVEGAFSLKGSRALARLLNCTDSDASGPRPLERGSTIPGFHVASAQRPVELALAGRHRFSRYALSFRRDWFVPGAFGRNCR
jgi:hypothetical protein